MNAYAPMTEAEATRIAGSGGTWLYRENRWMRVSMYVLCEALRQAVPIHLRTLAHRIGIRLAEMTDFEMRISDDAATLELVLFGNGKRARGIFQLPSAEIH